MPLGISQERNARPARSSPAWPWSAQLVVDGGRDEQAPTPATHRPAVVSTPVEVDRTVSRSGTVSLAGRIVPAAEILNGRRVTVRIEEHILMFFDPDTRELLRTRPNPIGWDRVRHLRDARPAGPPPRPSIEPITVQRVASNSGVIMVAGQKVALGGAAGTLPCLGH